MVVDGRLYALGSDAYWLDTGTPDAYLRAHRDLLSGRRAGPPAPDAVERPDLGRGVWAIGDVDASVKTVERSLLGRGASVAATAKVSGSVIGAGAQVEEGATVVDSVLLPGARVAARASVEGSIVGPDATIGQRCRISAISVIGAGAVIASGTSLDGERYPSGS
jgi:NDP-sugar pyrophosphorylase family protein